MGMTTRQVDLEMLDDNPWRLRQEINQESLHDSIRKIENRFPGNAADAEKKMSPSDESGS